MVNYGKLTVCELEHHDISWENPTISMAMSNSFLYVYQRVKSPWFPVKIFLTNPMMQVINLAGPSSLVYWRRYPMLSHVMLFRFQGGFRKYQRPHGYPFVKIVISNQTLLYRSTCQVHMILWVYQLQTDRGVSSYKHNSSGTMGKFTQTCC